MAVDEAPFPAMAPPGVDELTDAQQDQQVSLKQASVDAQEDGKLELSLEKMTEAICIGAASAMMYSRRAQLLMQLRRFNAAVSDCSAALAVNQDSAKAFKIRARAFAKLEKWEEAHSDFAQGLKIDWDEDTEAASKEAAAKSKDLQGAATKKRKRDEEVEHHRKLQEGREAYEAGLKANEKQRQEKMMNAAKERCAAAEAEEARKRRR